MGRGDYMEFAKNCVDIFQPEFDLKCLTRQLIWSSAAGSQQAGWAFSRENKTAIPPFRLKQEYRHCEFFKKRPGVINRRHGLLNPQ